MPRGSPSATRRRRVSPLRQTCSSDSPADLCRVSAAEHLRECNRQLDHADKIDALREQRKEHDAVKTTQEPSPSAKE